MKKHPVRLSKRFEKFLQDLSESFNIDMSEWAMDEGHEILKGIKHLERNE